MSIFKCKMCGGTIEFEQGTSVGICDSCGTKQTLPRLDDEKKANLYDRANHFRRNNEFDKAMGIYEQILNEDSSDAESYWSLVLCRYGIEYVEDPATHKRIPTVNRAQYISIFDDEDYKSALQYADGYQKEVYESEAAAINEIQKGILAISQKEEPFDVFICYKETDANGRRTQDSVLATELYHELTREGFKVFFSRITLEDKLGQEYEPYIFAALNSAKVMVVLGTKPEYFNAVWVKNEWSRYLALIKNGARKMLIPAYKDMDPYDLPEEFSHLQAQDMSKLGFMQDLIRGIKKIIGNNTDKQAVRATIVSSEVMNSNVTALLKRGFMALEDGEWTKADDFFEQCLNQNAELAEAYLGKLMAELQVKTQDNLKNCDESFEERSNYQKTIRFANSKLKEFLTDTVKYITERNERTRLEDTYNSAVEQMQQETSEFYFNSALKLFESISGYRDADILAKECREKAEIARKEGIYKRACEVLNDNHTWIGKDKSLEEAIAQFRSLNGWKDADEKIKICQEKIEEIRLIKLKEEADLLEAERKAEEEKRIADENAKRKAKNTIVIVVAILCVCIAFAIVLNVVIIPSQNEKNNRLEFYRAQISALKNVTEGDTIKFGAYEQDNNKLNGEEEIEWLVLAVEENKALIVSKFALDCKQYNNSYTDITWEQCKLRSWLNDSFLNDAFSSKHQKMIEYSNVSDDINPNYPTTPGNATIDKVFLLSTTEVDKYLSSNDERKCVPTKYAIEKGAVKYNPFLIGDDTAEYWYWLRSPGSNSSNAAIDGLITHFGRHVDDSETCVRPAMWIDLNIIE